MWVIHPRKGATETSPKRTKVRCAQRSCLCARLSSMVFYVLRVRTVRVSNFHFHFNECFYSLHTVCTHRCSFHCYIIDGYLLFCMSPVKCAKLKEHVTKPKLYLLLWHSIWTERDVCYFSDVLTSCVSFGQVPVTNFKRHKTADVIITQYI